MLSKENAFVEESEDTEELHDSPVAPIVFLPPSISTLRINDPPVDKDHWSMRFSGVMYTLLASFLFTCTAFSLKQIGVDLLDALLLRFVIQTLATFVFVRHKKYPILFGTPMQIFLQFLCCATGAGGFFVYFIAIRYVELSDVTTLCYTRVVWTVLFGMCIFKERSLMTSLIALPLTLLGVVFVAQPTFLFPSANSKIVSSSELRILGLALAIISSFTSATNVLSFKQLLSTSKGIKPSVINLQYCLAILISLIVNQLYKKFVLQNGLSVEYITSWRYLLASFVCLILIGSNISTQKAIKREHPAVVTLLGSADIIFSLALQNIFTTKRSNIFALLGSVLVICSVLIIGLSKILHERSARKKIKLMDKKIIRQEFDEEHSKC